MSMIISGKKNKLLSAIASNQLYACLVPATSPHAHDAIGTAGGVFTEVTFPVNRQFLGPAILLPNAAQRAEGAVHGEYLLATGSAPTKGMLKQLVADGFGEEGSENFVSNSVWPVFSGTFKVLDVNTFASTFVAPTSGALQCSPDYLAGRIPLEFEAPAAGTVLGVALYDASDNTLCALISAKPQAVCLESAALPKSDLFVSSAIYGLGLNIVSSRGVEFTRLNVPRENENTISAVGTGDLFARDRLMSAVSSFPKEVAGDADYVLIVNIEL